MKEEKGSRGTKEKLRDRRGRQARPQRNLPGRLMWILRSKSIPNKYGNVDRLVAGVGRQREGGRMGKWVAT